MPDVCFSVSLNSSRVSWNDVLATGSVKVDVFGTNEILDFLTTSEFSGAGLYSLVAGGATLAVAFSNRAFWISSLAGVILIVFSAGGFNLDDSLR